MNGQLYVVPELNNVFQQWVNQDNSFISQFILPEVPVDNERFITWNGGYEHLIIPSSTLRTGRTKYAESRFSRSTAEKGPLEEHGLSTFITDREYKLGGSPISVESQGTESLASQMRLLDEKDVADNFASTSVITHYTTKSGTGQWNNPGTSDPIEDIRLAVVAQRGNSPMPPNAAWCSWDVWMGGIVNNPAVIDRIKWSQLGYVREADFLTLLSPFGITKLYIAGARYNSANPQATQNITDVWGKHFWVGYINDTPGVKQINGGYKFTLRDMKRVFKETSMNPPGAELVTSDFYDHIFLSTAVYYMIQNAIA